jgi:hypothetical protein
MRALILALALTLAAAPALAQTVIAPADAPKHLGETVTIEGPASEVHIDSHSGVIFINMGGRFPNQACTGVIFKDDAGKFPDLDSLPGKVITITGRVKDYKGRCEIILNDPEQLKVNRDQSAFVRTNSRKRKNTFDMVVEKFSLGFRIQKRDVDITRDIRITIGFTARESNIQRSRFVVVPD